MFPDELIKLNRWVGCRNGSKVPIKCIPDDLRTDTPASTSNMNTWSSFDDADFGFSMGYIDNYGFVFYEPDGLVGIDIDDGKDEDDFPNELAWDIISNCKSYTEQSRSGRGYHIILKGKLPFLGKNNRNGVEIYKGGRYFIMTGRNEFYSQVIENQEAIDYVVNKYFPEFRESKEVESKNGRFYNPTYEKPQKGKISLKPIYPEIQQGCRNQSLLSLAGQLKAQGLSKKEVYMKVLQVNNSSCKPPLSALEVERVINSCFKYK